MHAHTHNTRVPCTRTTWFPEQHLTLPWTHSELLFIPYPAYTLHTLRSTSALDLILITGAVVEIAMEGEKLDPKTGQPIEQVATNRNNTTAYI